MLYSLILTGSAFLAGCFYSKKPSFDVVVLNSGYVKDTSGRNVFYTVGSKTLKQPHFCTINVFDKNEKISKLEEKLKEGDIIRVFYDRRYSFMDNDPNCNIRVKVRDVEVLK